MNNSLGEDSAPAYEPDASYRRKARTGGCPVSKLAKKIAASETVKANVRRGPPNMCFPIYGPGDLEDWQAVESIRAQGHDWRSVQAQVDRLAGVEKPLPLERFRYHWRRRCFCWPEDLRL